ncbi:uncharacterized protein GLRG_04062 [Colletotrichum graminicola M1.001]|uniref:DUF7707 domain-containing protein n=2 Tax=Colletotrichum graminicola TaxID=31870 RepID=E3QDE6_COLGM|nr:uncharacterized protein GLRG_04062 [Colletotrichum graminicola M1.001]EFQ28918.1 hypothetical protein GLRG_04062 [Colletotrichum graminicola M1.001]CAQ16257.1 hypothetical protein [Colletotrichum graminicola]
MRTSFAVLALSAASAVSAQRKVFTAADINVGALTVNEKANWCIAERNTCQSLCDAATKENNCDTTTLQYSCLCSSNGSAPGLEYYEQTMPTFICNQAFEDCITANVGNKNGQDNCTTSIRSQCGTINAQADQASGSTTSATSAATQAPSATGASNAGATTAPSTAVSSAWAAPTADPARYGNAAAVAAIGLFAYML